MQPIHTFTIKATSIVAGDFPEAMKEHQRNSDECYFTESTHIVLADYVELTQDHHRGTHITARMNDGAIAFQGFVEGHPFRYGELKKYNSELVRVVVENPNGKTTHIIGRPIQPVDPVTMKPSGSPVELPGEKRSSLGNTY